MTYIQESRTILSQAESDLRQLMKRAIDDQHYGELAAIAQWADALASLARGQASKPLSTPANGVTAPERKTSGRKAAHTQPKASKPSKSYPQFEREEDRLVKIGWSKKDRQTYEHRCPREIIFSIVDRLSTSVTPGKVFTMEPLLPFHDPHGQEVPAYQAYLVLKWLQHIGAVQKKGKDGYTAQGHALDHERIAQAWDALRER